MKKLLYILLTVPIIFSACKKEQGCTNPLAINYNLEAEDDDGSCIINGCTDSIADNFNQYATVDDSSCIYDIYINLSLPIYSALEVNGSSIFIEGGVEGIIIYHGVGNDYKVYDRNCSYQPSLSCSVINTVDSGIAYCACCSSAFLISNTGEVLNSPALLPLKTYNWSISNNILRIHLYGDGWS